MRHDDCKQVIAKRSLFSKPTWSRSQILGSPDLFHRSHQIYDSLNTADESHNVLTTDEQISPQMLDEGRNHKRRRVSSDCDGDDHHLADDDDHHHVGNKASTQHVSKALEGIDDSGLKTSTRSQPLPVVSSQQIISLDTVSHKKPRQLAENALSKPNMRSPSVIDIESDQSDLEAGGHEHNWDQDKSIEAIRSLMEEDTFSSSEEFPELARKARAKVRGEIEGRSVGSSVDHSGKVIITEYSEAAPQLVPDTIVQILITSSMPNTQPLILKRKLGQRLKDVRVTWAERQGFPQDVADSIFLTWKDKRLFDVTTCMNLSTMIGSLGKAAVMDELTADDHGRIHMEAMTADILESRRNAKLETAMPADNLEAITIPKPHDVDSQVRIILRAKDFAEFKLRVKPVRSFF